MTERGRRNLLIALTITIAATRFYARSRSMWDWDEALFAFAIRDFNVALHHPHPPGFPLFIALAKFMHLFVPDAFNDDRDRWRWIARARNESVDDIAVDADGNRGRRFSVEWRHRFERQYIIISGGKVHKVTIDLSRTVNPVGSHVSEDARDLGLELHSILWGAVD